MKLNFPKQILLAAIQERHIYKDEKSLEKSTGIIKRKYKLAGKWPDVLKNEDMRLFFVSTSKEYSVQSRSKIEISKDDYLTCKLSTLKNVVSYYNPGRYELLSGDDIKTKIDDIDNGFKDVATIKETSFEKFLHQAEKLKLGGRPPKTVEDLVTIMKCVADEEISNQKLKELHII